MQQLFPEAPISVLEKIPGKSNWDGHNLPFNRRKRRQIERSRTLVVHLFAGKEDSRWDQLQRDDLTVLNLDVLNGCNLLDDDLAGYLERPGGTRKGKHLVSWTPLQISKLASTQRWR